MDKNTDFSEDDESSHIISKFVPITAGLCVLGCVGLVGNIFTLMFYRSIPASSTVMFIRRLALVDLFINILMFSEGVEILLMTRKGVALNLACKLTKVVSIWVNSTSAIYIWMIAMDRHRKICKPFSKQLNLKHVKYACIGTSVFTGLFSLRAFVTYGTVSVNDFKDDWQHHHLFNYCTTKDDDTYIFVNTICIAIDCGLAVLGWVSICFAYTEVLVALYKAKSRSKAMRSTHFLSTRKSNRELNSEIKKNSQTSDNQETDMNSCGSKTESSAIKITAETEISNSKDRSTVVCKSVQIRDVSSDLKQSMESLHSFRSSRLTSMRDKKLTFMLITISITFIVCFSPYFIVKLYMRSFLENGPEIELEIPIQVLLKLPYLNCVINPWVYCIFNTEFRRYIKRKFSRCFGKCTG